MNNLSVLAPYLQARQKRVSGLQRLLEQQQEYGRQRGLVDYRETLEQQAEERKRRAEEADPYRIAQVRKLQQETEAYPEQQRRAVNLADLQRRNYESLIAKRDLRGAGTEPQPKFTGNTWKLLEMRASDDPEYQDWLTREVNIEYLLTHPKDFEEDSKRIFGGEEAVAAQPAEFYRFVQNRVAALSRERSTIRALKARKKQTLLPRVLSEGAGFGEMDYGAPPQKQDDLSGLSDEDLLELFR